MAPRKPATTPPPGTTTPPAQVTIGGHVVSILAFIPDNKGDVRAQAKVLDILADLQEGKKTIADVSPLLKLVEVKMNYTRKRMDKETAASLFAPAPQPAEEQQQDDEHKDD